MTRIRPRRPTPRRREAPRGDADWWAWANPLLLARCRDRCDRCGQPLAGQMERHHRQRREVGGDRLANLLALHPRCHAYITEHPEEARANGWIVSAHAPDPSTVPVRLSVGGGLLWLLDDDGGRRVVP